VPSVVVSWRYASPVTRDAASYVYSVTTPFGRVTLVRRPAASYVTVTTLLPWVIVRSRFALSKAYVTAGWPATVMLVRRPAAS
jgi:hypothetical protein